MPSIAHCFTNGCARVAGHISSQGKERKTYVILYHRNRYSCPHRYNLFMEPSYLALLQLLPTFQVKSNFFGPEMIVRGYRMKFRCVQVPVNYKERTGQSSVTGHLRKTLLLGGQMLILIVAMRFGMERWLLRLLK